ncbi:hypothetical protein B9479_005188 [Cryptococcus floricola]|uniref:Uncharacterized protein n=1 Tax=Cryptococcus floricola TaxID=2591691 RepID=A0A5D3ARN5_9TREE|nr:hypothetical protein B9479_005188 [Cryptococcus floricola]
MSPISPSPSSFTLSEPNHQHQQKMEGRESSSEEEEEGERRRKDSQTKHKSAPNFLPVHLASPHSFSLFLPSSLSFATSCGETNLSAGPDTGFGRGGRLGMV